MYKQTNKQQTENTLELFEMQMIGIKHLSDMLRMSDMDKIKLTHDVFKANGVPTKALPIYVDTETTITTTELLSHLTEPMSVAEFNSKMIRLGLIELQECTTGGKTKEFKSLTAKGLKYGKNLVNPKNNNETQPHYYESKFKELLDLIN